MVFAPLIVQSVTKSILFVTDRIQVIRGGDQNKSSKQSQEKLVLYDKPASALQFLYPRSAEVMSHPHSTGSLTFFRYKQRKRIVDFTIGIEENVGLVNPQDAVQHAIAELKGKYNVKTVDEGTCQVGPRVGYYAVVIYPYFQQPFKKRISAFKIQDDSICIFQMVAHRDLQERELDMYDRIIDSIKPVHYHGRGFLALYQKNVKMLLPSHHYRVQRDDDFIFSAHIKTPTGNVVEGITMERLEKDLSLEQVEATNKGKYDNEICGSFEAGPYKCVYVTYTGRSNETSYKFADIHFVCAKEKNIRGPTYLMNVYAKPERFQDFLQSIETCISTLRFFPPSCNNQFYEYYDYDRGFKIKIPIFMKLQELEEATPFLRFNSNQVSNSVSMTVSNAPLPKFDPRELQSTDQFTKESAQAVQDRIDRERSHQLQILKREMLHQISAGQTPYIAIKLIHTDELTSDGCPALRIIYSQHNYMSGEKMIYYNTFIVGHECRIFRIQSCAPTLHLPANLEKMFLNIHASVEFIKM